MKLKFDKNILAVEQKNYLSEIVNVYIVCHLDALPRNPTNSFKFKNCLFGASSVVKNSDKKTMCMVATEEHLIVQVLEVLIMTVLQIL